MKRILSLIFLLSLLISLLSCGNTSSLEVISAEEPTLTETKESEKNPKPVFYYVAEPLTWEKINSIPVANNSMTTDELRQIIVDFTRLQMTFPWQPNYPVLFQQMSGKDFAVNINSVYGGCPYVSSNFSNLYQIMAYYDEETGILDTKKMGAALPSIMGNQCSSSTFWGWVRVCNNITWGGTNEMVLKHGCIKVGPYEYDQTIDTFAGQNTQKICAANGEQMMYQSYAMVLLADGIVQSGDTGGHVCMISEKPTVVYKESGEIDGDKSFVVYQDQQTAWFPGVQSNGKTYLYQGGVDTKVSFKKLFDQKYVPFTFAELIGQDDVEKAEVSFAIEEDGATIEELLQAKITANYPLSEVFIRIKNSQGDVVFEDTEKVSTTSLCHYDFCLDDGFIFASTLRKYEGNTVILSARVGTGETLPVWEGTLLAKS